MTDIPNSLHIIHHPLIVDKLSRLRDKSCSSIAFRTLLREITALMTFEVLKDLPTTTRLVETPLTQIKAPVLADPAPSIIPILRAGLGMSEALMELIPSASIGHIGVYRDHDTKEPVEYLVKLPKACGQPYVVVDPMLATGNSLVYACDVLNKNGIKDEQIRVMALVIAPEGIRTFAAKHPTIPVFGAALDSHLNEHAYIVPGLGDAGDRIFGTT
ncbi:MAG: uracil phosphoribosyltransferase [Proteobacteria bacterium]|nr:uracil phosphoribosyltransferase [Alphaproteobacteria bacterium]NCC02825.1 uracil phosphoribosyltransferase [Pseudomonadota bacterium]